MDATADQSPLLSHPETANANGRQSCYVRGDSSYGYYAAIVISLCCIGIFVAVLVKHPFEPLCYIGKLYIPARDKSSSNDTQSINFATTISFVLTFWNNHDDVKVYYDNVNLRFHVSSPSGNVTIPKFDVGHIRTVQYPLTIETFGVPWEDARVAVSRVVFRVDMDAKFRFAHLLSEILPKSKEYGMKLVPVNKFF